MKRFKKLLAFAVSCTMIFGTMSMMSFADPVKPSDQMNELTFDSSIEITGLEAGDKVKFYKVLEWAGSRPADQTEEEYKKEVYGGWKFVSPFSASGISDDEISFSSNAEAIEEIIGDPAGKPAVEFGLTSKIAGKLAKLAGDPVETVEVTGDSASISITETGVGLYMALITPKDAKTVYSPVFVSADFNTENPSASWAVTSAASYSTKNKAQAAAKKSTTVTNKEDDLGEHSYDQTWRSARPGETVKYKVTFTVPGYGKVYDKPVFTAYDKLEGMTLVATPEITAPKDAVAKITGEPGTDNYKIEFDTDYLKSLAVATDVVVEYSAVIDENAPLNVNTKTNEIWTEYSHDPKDEKDFDVKKDGTNSYVYTINADLLGGYEEGIEYSGVEIIKVGVDAHGNPINSEKQTSSYISGEGWKGPLAGAIFKLYTDKDCKPENEYKDANGDPLPEIKSGADGRFKIEGLDAGIYYLREEQAPSGYIKSTDPVKVEIKPYFTTEKVTEYYKPGEEGQPGTWSYTKSEGAKEVTYDIEVLDHYEVLFNDKVAADHHYYNEGKKEIKVSNTGTKEIPSSIVNTKGVELPATGGMGTTIFYVIGAVLVLGAGILLVTRRRMNIQ